MISFCTFWLLTLFCVVIEVKNLHPTLLLVGNNSLFSFFITWNIQKRIA